MSTVPLTAVAFNRDGDAVGIASQTGTVYLFNATRDGYAYKKSGKINSGRGLTSLDWSEDGDHIQVGAATFCPTSFDQKSFHFFGFCPKSRFLVSILI